MGGMSELITRANSIPIFGSTIYCIQAPCPQGGSTGQVYTPKPDQTPTPVPTPAPAPAKPTGSALPLLIGAAYLLLA